MEKSKKQLLFFSIWISGALTPIVAINVLTGHALASAIGGILFTFWTFISLAGISEAGKNHERN